MDDCFLSINAEVIWKKRI